MAETHRLHRKSRHEYTPEPSPEPDVKPDSDHRPPVADQTPTNQNHTTKANHIRPPVHPEALLPFIPERHTDPAIDENTSLSLDEVVDEMFALIPQFILQMMFVAGETGEPSNETLSLIEQIVHEQVYEMVR